MLKLYPLEPVNDFIGKSDLICGCSQGLALNQYDADRDES